MKTSDLALRASLVAAILATASSAFAADSWLGGLGNLFGRGASEAEYVVDDGSFFGGEALTIGGVSSVSYEAPLGGFVASASNGSYSGCAGCADETSYVGGGIPAAIDGAYCGNPCDPCAFPCDPCATGWVEYPVYTAPCRPFRPIRNILAGVKNFLFGDCGYRYCQPAYVCDPCWTVCEDPCWSPCAPCETSCGGEVYAPAGCCGDGYMPGETNPLNPQTGLSGIDATVSPNPTPIQTAEPTQNAPAIPSQTAPGPVFEQGAAPETIPTPAADPTIGSGVLQMLVPEDSVVYVNGYRTKQTGTTRSFAANNLEYGETYSFEIRVVAVRNGQLYEDVQHATLTAGESTALAFNLNRVRSNEAVALNR